MIHRRNALALLLGAPLLAGCVTAQPRWLEPGPGGEYRLAAGDRLRIIVFGQDDLSNLYTVEPGGTIAMPLIGAVPVAGATTRTVEARVAERLRGGFLRDPQVAVEVDTYRPFFILGEVASPGQFPYVDGLTVQTAVAIAGGFTPRAARTNAEITREVGDAIVTEAVPMTFPVRPGDTIVVAERWL
ncbi:polysaccharide biosynthesis/export family protein [Salinarimonas rosea]|uniref:polysaccharide biosynthesis/export family protein n=1 Tax=Salinarimonas rosea TaxID=552063 RepID=UPI000424B854|nr:polysaccharide biosynthesis/export family protein [Salinarimonas rosea]